MIRKYAVLLATLLAGIAFNLGAAPRAAAQSASAPDSIYYDGKIVTVDDHFSYAQAVAITSDKFTAIGLNDAIRKLAINRDYGIGELVFHSQQGFPSYCLFSS